MAEKRRHPRMVHRDVVRFDTAGTTIEGRSVDISRTGIQVEVAAPHSFDNVRSIRFSIPNTGRELELPVRLTRAEGAGSDKGSLRLGFEFLRGSNQHIRLIENYIRDSVQTAEQDHRRIPRIDTSIPIECGDGLDRGTIENISPSGVLISAEGTAAVHTELHLSFLLPGSTRPIETSARVVYTMYGESGGHIRFGASFLDLPQVHRARIHNFIEQTTASQSLQSVWSLMDAGGQQGYWAGGGEIASILQRVPGVIFHVLFEGEFTIYTGTPVCHGKTLSLTITPPLSTVPKPGQRVFVTFTAMGSNYYFTANVITTKQEGETVVVADIPDKVHRSDNRSNRRESVHGNTMVKLIPADSGISCTGHLIDVSQRGFLCSIIAPENAATYLKPGIVIDIEPTGSVEIQSFGRVRHVEVRRVETPSTESTNTSLYVGVETGIRRGPYTRMEISPADWEQRVRTIRDGTPEPTPLVETHRVTYHNRQNRKIVGLINRVAGDGGGNEKPTVVIIPPAFGKKKENPAPLALTLCTTFHRAGAPLVVIRYDGINRPGESHNESEQAIRGYEMLHYRPTQGVEDIAATLDYVFANGDFTPGRVILITSSMSSVDARKLLVRDHRVNLWISLMGVPAGRTTLMNVLSGTDIVANYRLNIPNGVRGMLGHLVNMDTVARDLVEEKYAFIADARYDMALIDIPIVWIVGQHDHWVAKGEVDDIMSVDAGAPRDVIQIPTGHNLRNSDDAAEAFRIITQYCADAAGLGITAVPPSRETVLTLLSREREGLYQPIDTDEVTAYWQSYLLGNDRESEGYDFYQNLAEFREFIDREAELLDPRPGDRIADMGCGTGILTEAILRRLIADNLAAEIVAVDLIPDALARAEKKCRSLLTQSRATTNISMQFEVRNLEPNRFAPLRDFSAHEELPIAFLKGRIEGLPDSVIDRWNEANDPRLSMYLRGHDVSLSDRHPDRNIADEIRRATLFAIDGDIGNTGRVDTSALYFGDSLHPGHEPEIVRHYNSLAASLFISYILNPDYLLWSFHRMLQPGGKILLSSMRPDSDVSKIFTSYIESVDAGHTDSTHRAAADAMLNEAAALFELEEEGYFRFYTADELCSMLVDAGFVDVHVESSLGTPAQAYIATGIAVDSPREPWRKYV